MDEVQEKEMEWEIPQIIPKRSITLEAGDGGSGKTSVWCSFAAAISTGKKVFFDSTPDEFVKCEPKRVLFFSSEDSLEYTLKARLRKAGANLSNIFSISLANEEFSNVKFNSQYLRDLIKEIRPALYIFDPIQSFVPPTLQMSQRNAMRDCLNSLVGLGEEFDTTFIIVVHTNKKIGAYGRNRISDSADIWDIARSVLIVGNVPNEKGKRYLSQEKSNYAEEAETVIFTIEDGVAKFCETSDKKDVDFVKERDASSYQAPQRKDAERFITEFLKNGKKPTKELDEVASAEGISIGTLKRAKAELSKAGVLGTMSEGYGQGKIFYSFLKERSS